MATKSGSRRYVPERGDIVWLTFDPQAGHEEAGRRPAVTLSPAYYNSKAGLALFAPVTSQVKGYPFEVIIPPDMPISGVILTDHLKSLDWRVRKATLICKLPFETVQEVVRKAVLLIAPAG